MAMGPSSRQAGGRLEGRTVGNLRLVPTVDDSSKVSNRGPVPERDDPLLVARNIVSWSAFGPPALQRSHVQGGILTSSTEVVERPRSHGRTLGKNEHPQPDGRTPMLRTCTSNGRTLRPTTCTMEERYGRTPRPPQGQIRRVVDRLVAGIRVLPDGG